MILNVLRWRITLTITLVLPLLALFILVLLSLGAADPPFAGPLQWSIHSPTSWIHQQVTANLLLDHAPDELPTVFTLEISGENEGPPDSAWGVALDDTGLVLLVNNQGYYSAQEGTEPRWVEFPHIRPDETNTIRLDYHENGLFVLRINAEIAWSQLYPGKVRTWALAHYRQPQISWHKLARFSAALPHDQKPD